MCRIPGGATARELPAHKPATASAFRPTSAEGNGHRRSACCAAWVLCVAEGQLHRPSGLNLPRPAAAGPPGRSICSSLISCVFGVSPLCIPSRSKPLPCLLPNPGSFGGPVKHAIPGLCCPHNPGISCNPGIVAPFWELLRTPVAIRGLNYTKAPTTPRHLQSQNCRAAIPIPGFCNPRKSQFPGLGRGPGAGRLRGGDPRSTPGFRRILPHSSRGTLPPLVPQLR